MPYRSLPTFKPVAEKMLEIPQPAIGGLNLKDLEFEQEVNQSPYMMNVMYRNGAFGKRFGQEVHSTYADVIYATASYGGDIFVHAGKKIYKYDSEGEHTQVGSGMPEAKGLFITFAQKLYYLTSNGFYVYSTSFGALETYVPDVYINCKPDGTGGADVIDDFNIIGSQFNMYYNGTTGTTVYEVGPYDSEDVIDWTVTPSIKVDDVEWTYDASLSQNNTFKFDSTTKQVTFNPAPGEGDMNVCMTFTMKSTTFSTEKAQIYGCKYYDTFGGANNSRLFLAGGGHSKYFYSQAYDLSYFPENNFATLGNTEEDITGFGRQYNVLIVFKPREVYSIYSYVQTAATTIVEEDIGLEGFRSQLVNARMGCDAPGSIQIVENLLTWFNSDEGICTLVSTNIQDERNVRLLSRNIERTNNFDVPGILDLPDDPLSIQSIDYNNKYFLVFPESGYCYMWDYEIAPYHYSSTTGETPTKNLAWFLFDHFYVKEFLKFEKELLYASNYKDDNCDFTESLIKLNAGFADLDFSGDGESDPIHSYYMTPFFQFGAVEMLKNVKNIYVQCRGDTASVIDMYYYTEENITPEEEPESIRIGGKLWAHFRWDNFQWLVVNWANTFRRKCNLKKIQMASFYFTNNEVNRDMSITHIGLQYQLVKYIR